MCPRWYHTLGFAKASILGSYAAAQPYNRKELEPTPPEYTHRPAVGRVRPSTPVVLCARMLGWSQEPAATAVVTGLHLIPWGSVLPCRGSCAPCSPPLTVLLWR